MARPRLSRGGDYVPPDANVVARGLFIDAVARLVPEALNELKELAPRLPDLSSQDGSTHHRERPLRQWCWERGFTAVPWEKRDRDEIGMMHEYPLHRDWLLELARGTAQWLRKGADPSLTPSDIIKMCVTASYAALDVPDMKTPYWNPDVEREVSFRARVDDYIVQVNQLATAAGRVPARAPQHPERDFECLALFQVRRMEAVEISERCPVPRPSVDSIREALEVAAKEAGVHLRPARRGRPPDK